MTKTSIIELDLAKRVRTRQARYADAMTLDGHGHPVADLFPA
ncbi:MAG: hypothetical protein ACT4O2_01985 [Beijerinckiaceae bacterium]